ncbi:MAG: hypothetical protein Q4D98_08650 [Planctomycetia bacterium]|nr:hypothetical protein [Planctomycetia bacterium]
MKRWTVLCWFCLFAVALGAEEPSYKLVSKRKPGDVDHVQKQIDVAGRLVVFVNPQTGTSVSTPATNTEADTHANKKEQRIPLKVRGIQELEEVFIEPGNFLQGEQAKSTLGAWYFLKDDTTLTVDNKEEKPKLQPDSPLMAVDIREANVRLFRPEGLLTREEHDLVDLQGNTLLLDFLLPHREMKIGESWKQSPDVMAVLLQLDLVFQMDIQSKLLEVKKNTAIIEISGWIEGSSDGTSSKMDVQGKYYFHLPTGRITWFGIIIRENRAAGYVVPGMEVVARLQYRIKPLATPEHLTPAVVEKITFDPKQYDLLSFTDPGKQWQFLMDSHWYATNWNERQSNFRLVKGGNLIAECSVATPVDVQSTQKFTLEQFVENIQKTLGDSFKEIVSQNSSTRDDGTTIYRVDVSGVVEDLQLRWIYYLITRNGEQPRQETAVFIVEEKLLEAFQSSDQQMIESFEWVESGEKE